MWGWLCWGRPLAPRVPQGQARGGCGGDRPRLGLRSQPRLAPTCFADVKGPSFALSHGRGFPTAPRECAHHSLISLSLLRREKQRESSGLQPGFRAPALPRGAAVMPSLLTPQTAKPILSILDHHRYSAGRRCAMTPRQECG